MHVATRHRPGLAYDVTDKRKAEIQRKFLDLLRKGTGVKKAALEFPDVTYRVIRGWRMKDKDGFGKECVAAMKEGGISAPSTRKRRTKRSKLQYGSKFNDRKYKEKFLTALALGKSPSMAAREADVSVPTVYTWRKRNELFAAAWDWAVQEGVDRLEDEALRRAVEGTLKPVFQGKELVGHVREYSDKLLVLLLKGRRPHVYNRSYHEHSGPGGGPIPIRMTVQQAKQRLAELGISKAEDLFSEEEDDDEGVIDADYVVVNNDDAVREDDL